MKQRGKHRVAGLLALLTAACAAAPPPTGDATIVDAPVTETRARVERSLRVRGLTLVGNPVGPGAIVALATGPADRGWAACPTLTMVDPSRRTNRQARITPRSVTTRATASFAEAGAGATRVVIRADQTGSYVNPFTNNPEARSCPSTGALESEVLQAIRLG